MWGKDFRALQAPPPEGKAYLHKVARLKEFGMPQHLGNVSAREV